MKTIAQILYDKVHYIFEAEEIPDWPPYPDGERPLLVDITHHIVVREGWDYNHETGEFTEPVYIPPDPEDYVEPEPIPPTQLDVIEEMIIENAIETDFRFTMLEMNLGIGD